MRVWCADEEDDAEPDRQAENDAEVEDMFALEGGCWSPLYALLDLLHTAMPSVSCWFS